MSITRKLITGVATGALGLGLALGGSAAAAQPAEAASWFPQKPSTKQPVGWGSVCAVVTERGYWWGQTKVKEYRWFTTSLGGSTCAYYKVR